MLKSVVYFSCMYVFVGHNVKVNDIINANSKYLFFKCISFFPFCMYQCDTVLYIIDVFSVSIQFLIMVCYIQLGISHTKVLNMVCFHLR